MRVDFLTHLVKCRAWRSIAASWVVYTLAGSAATAQDKSVVHSKHNLSARGPGTTRALNEQEVCIFCHTPHNAQPQSALWNRQFPDMHYRIYDSSTTDARIGQPSGPSKMCLSCHDGSVALGNLLS